MSRNSIPRFSRRGTALVSNRKDFETEVGDTQQVDFQPQVKVKRWANESNFSMRLPMPRGLQTVVGNAVEYDTPKIKAQFYETDEGFEFGVILKVRPARNTLQFTLQHKGLRFEYQDTWFDVNGDPTETKVNVEGTHYRPFNIQGSYSAYHSSKKNNQYGSGKAFHILRPWAQDAAGNRVWCELDIDPIANTLTITTPTEFLRSAQYPVFVDPTMGYTTIGGSSTNSSRAWGYRVQAPEAGTINDIVGYHGGVAGETGEAAIYDESASAPNNLLSESNQITMVNNAWNTYTGLSQAITSGTWYWLCNDSSAAVTTFWDTNAGADRGSWVQTYSAWEDPHGGFDATSKQDLSIYANYTTTLTVSGTSATTNANDTQTSAGTLKVSGTGATTDANDSHAAEGTAGIVGTAATTNVDGTQVAAGTLANTGTAAATNAADTHTAIGLLGALGTSATPNAADTHAAVGEAAPLGITGTSATTNAPDSQAGVGLLASSGAAATINASDTQAASGIVGDIISEPGRIFSASIPLRAYRAAVPIRAHRAALPIRTYRAAA